MGISTKLIKPSDPRYVHGRTCIRFVVRVIVVTIDETRRNKIKERVSRTFFSILFKSQCHIFVELQTDSYLLAFCNVISILKRRQTVTYQSINIVRVHHVKYLIKKKKKRK